MRFAFAGTAPFAALVFTGLAEASELPCALVTNPDRPRGRHGTPVPPVIKEMALARGVPVFQPPRLTEPADAAALLELAPEILVVCAYGRIVGPAFMDALPAIVVHPSPVPRWRGAAPVERALMAGETELGVAVLRMTAGVDEGPVGFEQPVHVPRSADAGAAYEALAPVAVDGVRQVLAGIADGSVEWRPQTGPASYAAKIGAADKAIDWSRPGQEIVDQVRALSPHIGAQTELLGKRTRIWSAAAGAGPLPAPATGRLALPAGAGWVDVLELQQEGRKRMSAAEFLRGAGRALAGS
jgi:methionyl-tRNA formyltransferase